MVTDLPTSIIAQAIQLSRAGREARLASAQEQAVPALAVPAPPPEMRYRIQVWDMESGERVAEFERSAPNTPLVGLALSPDGTRLATASVAAPSPQNPNAPGGPQPVIIPAPQAQRIPAPATCEATGDDTESEQASVKQPPQPIQVPGGPGVPGPGPAMGPPAGDIELWDVATRKLARTIPASQGPPRQVAWSADGKFVGAIFGRAGGSGGFGSGGFASWDAASGQRGTALPGDFAALAFPVEGEQLAAAPTQRLSLLEQGRRRSEGPDSEIRLWQSMQLGMRQSPDGRPGHPMPVAPGQPIPEPAPDEPVPGEVKEEVPQDVIPGEPVPGEVKEEVPQDVMPPIFPNQPDSSMPLTGLPAAARSLAFAPSDALTSGYGQAALAVAGGDALLVEREGNVRLWHPQFDPMGHADLWGHTGRVNAVAYRADGKQIVTGGADGIVKVWTTEVAPEVIRLREYMSATRVAFSRDGKFLAVGHRAKHWTASRGFGEFASQPMPPGGGPGGEREPGPDNLKIYDVRNGRELLHLAAPGGDVVGLVFHPRGDWLAAATSDGTVTLWNLESGQSIATLRAPTPLACLDVSPDGEFIAGGCTLTRSVSEGMPAQPSVAPQPAAPAPAAPAPPPSAPQASLRNSISFVIWRVSDKSVAATIPAHADGVVSVAFSLDGKRLASAGLDDRVRLWDIATSRALLELEPHDGTVVDLAFRPDSDDIAGAVLRLPCRPGHPGDVVIWDASSGKKRRVIAAHAEAAYSVAYSRDGRRLASCGGAAEGSLSQPGEIKVWHADTGIELLPLAGSAGRDTKTVHYWKDERYTVTRPVFETQEVDVEQDGQKIKRQVTVSRLVREEHVRKITGGGSHVWWEIPGAATDIAFSDDGFRLAAACEDGTARIWDGFVCQPHDTARWPAFSANAIAMPLTGKHCGPSAVQIAASSDGRWIVVADSAGNQCDLFEGTLLRVFDAKTGRFVRTIGRLDNSARSISMSSNNRWLAVALDIVQMVPPMAQQPDGSFKPVGPPPKPRGGSVEVWDITTGERVSVFTGHEQYAMAVAFDPSGERVVSGGPDGLRLWDAKSGSELKAAKNAVVWGVAWSSDRNVVFLSWMGHGGSANAPKELAVWDVEDAAPPRTLKTMPENVMFAPQPLAFDAATGRAVVACTLPGTIGNERGQLHFIPIDKPDDSQVQTLGRGMLWSVAASSDGKRLATVGSDWCVNIWDAERRSLLLHLGGHLDDVRGTVFLPDGRIASVGADHQLKVWHADKSLDRTAACHETDSPRKRTTRLRGTGWGYVSRLASAYRSPLAATAEFTLQQQPPRPREPNEPPPQPKYDGVVRLWNTETGASLGTISVPGALLNDVALTADVSHLAVAGADGVIKIFKLDGAQEVAQCRGHQGPAQDRQYRGTGVTSVAFHPDGQTLASAGQDGTIRVWNLAGQEQFQLTPAASVTRLAFHPDGTMLAAGFGDRTVRLWSLADRKEIRTLKRHYGVVTDLRFNADGLRLAVTSTRYDHERQRWTGDLKVWDVASGRRIVSTPAHTWHDATLAFHPTLPHIAIASGIEHTVQVRHAETGRLVLSVPTGGHEVGGLAYSNAGDRLIFSRGGEVLMVDSTPEASPLGSAIRPAAATATQSASDEAAARWVLEKGGRIHVRSDGIVDEIANVADLPTDPYVVTAVLLGGRPEIKDADVAVLNSLEHLTTLSLNLPGISDAAFDGLASLKNLRAIHAEGSQATGSFLVAFRDRKQLQHLSLAGSKLNDAGVQHLAGSELAGCSLYDTAITDAAIPVLKQAVTGGLSIARTKLTDAGLTQLAGFRGNSLIIDGNAVTDAGLRSFLASKPRLHQLGIAHTAVTDTIIDALAEIKTLQSVSLQGTKVTAEGVARLKSALPNCQVH